MSRASTFTLNPGPPGACSDCEQTTIVRLGGFLGTPKQTKWKISPELLDAIHHDCRGLLRRGGQNIKTKQADGTKAKVYRIGLYLTCPFCDKFKREGADSPRAAKLVWVALDGDLGALPEALAGPFCNHCFKQQKKLFEHTDGSPFDPHVYYLSPTAKWVEMFEQRYEIKKVAAPVEVADEDLF